MKKPYKAIQTPVCRCGKTPVIRRRRNFEWMLENGILRLKRNHGYKWIVYCPCYDRGLYHRGVLRHTKRAAIEAFEKANAVEVNP